MPIPFAVKDINHFWRNHTIRKNYDDKIRVTRPQINLTFAEEEDYTVTIFYSDHGKKKERTIPYDDYMHWWASWWATFGVWEVRKRLGLSLFDSIPESEYPKIEEVQ